LNELPAILKIGSGRTVPKGTIDAHGLAPIGDGAMRILIEYLLETLLSFFVPEGMEKGESALKFLLN
jgi:hypothetical protein